VQDSTSKFNINEKEYNRDAVQKLQPKSPYSAAKAIVVIGRERAQGGSEWVSIDLAGYDCNMFNFWHNPYKKKQHKKYPRENPKHCGNKRQYVMCFDSVLDLPTDLVGFLVKAAQFVQWDTGYIKRPRKKNFASAEDIADLLHMSRRTAFRKIGQLVDLGVFLKDGNNYRINSSFVRKGAKKK